MIRNLLFRRSPTCENSTCEKSEQTIRRRAVIPQRFDYDENIIKTITKHSKTKVDEMFIRSAIENNDFLCSLLKNKKLQDVIDCMYSQEVSPKEVIIKQGAQDGSHLYISITGTYEVIQEDKIINTFSDVRVFGELALLYDAKRLATIKARTCGKIFVLDRVIFKHLMIRSDIEQHEEIVTFLKQVPKLNTVPHQVLDKVASLLQLEFFATGTKIVQEGDKKPNEFYIIKAGSVTVSKNNEGMIDRLYKKSFFGELALLKENERKATVTADAPGTECFILTRREFISHFGDIPDCFSINVQTQPYKPIEEIIEHTDLILQDLKIINTLGIGSFGRIELVQHINKKELVFALKCIRKLIITRNLQKQVLNEKNIQINCKNNFIVRLYRTFKDSKCLYFLLEPCLGGDLWTHIYKKKNYRFDNNVARFYVACVIEAFNYLHDRNIIYRDLKPENLLIDAKGYIKLTDFSFAKKLQMLKKSLKKTYTFAGTPEYVAPEIILNQGHDKAVDFWTLGVFIFELLTGRTPFQQDDDPSYMKTYKTILKGVENVEFPIDLLMSKEAKDLIKKLCQSTPSLRLRLIDDVKKHDWFDGFEWDKLQDLKVPAPFRPNLKTNVDLHYFENFKNYDEERQDQSTPLDDDDDNEFGWDHDF